MNNTGKTPVIGLYAWHAPRALISIAGIALAMVMLFAASASAGSRQIVTVSATTKQPGTPMGVTVKAVYTDGETPPGAPYALRHVDDRLPPGTVVNKAAVPVCTANDVTLMVLGPSACPASRVGDGHVTFDLGAGLLMHITLTLLNAGPEVLFLGEHPATGLRIVGHGKWLGTSISLDIPKLPGLGRGGAVVLDEDFTFTAATGFLTSPPSCPAEGAWNFVRDHSYSDGAAQRITAPMPCDKPRSKKTRPHRKRKAKRSCRRAQQRSATSTARCPR